MQQTNYITASMCVPKISYPSSVPGHTWVKVTVKIACDLLLTSFIMVDAVTLVSTQWYHCCKVLINSSMPCNNVNTLLWHMQTEVSEEHVDTNQKLKFYQPMRVSKVHQISNGLVVRDNMSTKICR